MARIASTGQTFRVAAQKTIEATHRILVATAKREHAKVMAADPRPASFTRIVDGRQGAREEEVRPDGVIVYRYPRLEQVVQFAMETLFDLSPVLSGDYRNAHTLFVSGQPAANLKGWEPGEEISISNPLPYSRKIEVGKMTMRVPGTSMVYQQARRKVMARYGNLATIDFTYRAIIGGRGVNQALAASSGKSWWLGHSGESRAATGAFEKTLGSTAHNRANTRFPVLIIKER